MVEMKRCWMCEQEKPLSEFHKCKSKPDGLQNMCKECHGEYYQDNKEKIAEQKKQWRQENREEIAEYNRKYRQENREEILERDRLYRQENREERLEYQKQWEKNNPEYYKQWCQENPEKRRERNHNYRARKNNAEGEFTEEQFQMVLDAYCSKCLACGAPFTTENPATRDHVAPLIRQGSNHIFNIQPLCGSCNSKKHTQNVDYRPFWILETMNDIPEREALTPFDQFFIRRKKQ